MAFSDIVHTLYAVQLDPGNGAADKTLLDQLSDFSVDPNINELLVAADGHVDAKYVAVGSQQPNITFTSSAIAKVLAKVGIAGFDFSGAAAGAYDGAGLEAWFQKIVEHGTRGGASSHIKMTAAKGLIVPRTLTAPHEPPATISLEAIPSWDGTNDPIVLATGQSLGGSPDVTEQFCAGPVSINGTTYEGVQSIDIDFGITLTIRGGSGNVWPEFVGIQFRRPSIVIRTLDVTSLSTFGLLGTAQGATDSIIYLRKVAEGAGRVADATEEHISFTIDEGRIWCGPATATQDAEAEGEIRITPVYDGTNDVLVIATAVAIA